MTQENTDNLPAQRFSDNEIMALNKTGDWLPRLTLYGSNSKECKKLEDPFKMGHWGVARSSNVSPEDLGSAVNVIVCAYRGKALDISGDQLISIYDLKNPEFARIKQQSETPNSGCMFGVEYLVWIPDISEFATLFMCSASAKQESPNLMRICKTTKFATLKVKLASNKRFQWHAPVVTICSDEPDNVPDEEALKSQILKFVNESDTEVELAPEEKGTGRTR